MRRRVSPAYVVLYCALMLLIAHVCSELEPLNLQTHLYLLDSPPIHLQYLQYLHLSVILH